MDIVDKLVILRKLGIKPIFEITLTPNPKDSEKMMLLVKVSFLN